MDKPLYTYDEAAELCGVSRWTIQRWVRMKRLRTVGRGKITAGSIRRLGELDDGALEDDIFSAPGVQEEEKAACRTNVAGRRSTGRRTSTQAARELDALLGQRIWKPRKQ